MVLDYDLQNNLILENYWKKRYTKGKVIQNKKTINENSDELIDKYDIRSGQGSSTVVRSMSGGNQQKAIIAREIERDPEILVAVQPTRGLDVGAIENIHNQLINERDKGKAILLISLELDEILDVSDRIAVIYDGSIVGEFEQEEANEQNVGLLMAGGKENDAQNS